MAAVKTSQPPSLEIVTEEVPLPPEFSRPSLQSSQFVSISSKDYSTVANTWCFTTLQPNSSSVVDIIREDFADGVSFQKINLATDIISFTQSYDGQALLVIDKKLGAVIIRRNKETSRGIELLPDFRRLLEHNHQACSPSFGGFLAISNDARQCVFHAGTDDSVYVFIERPRRLPSWMTLKLDWPSDSSDKLVVGGVGGRVIGSRFVQTETGTIMCAVAASYYARSAKNNQPTLVVSSFLIRPIFEQAHFLSRPQCGEVKQFKCVFQLRSLGTSLVPNNQLGSLVSTISHSGNILALAVNQNQANLSLDNSRLLFISLHIRALVVCRLTNILANQHDIVTDLAWLRSDLLCAVCTARGRFAIFASGSGAIRLILNEVASPGDELRPIISGGGSVRDAKSQQKLHHSINLLTAQPNSTAVLMRNKLAIHVSEPVFLCYSLTQAGHVLVRNVPPRLRIIRDFSSAAETHIKEGDFMAAGRLNLSAWGLIATSSESFHDRQMNIIRHLSAQTFLICSSFVSESHSGQFLEKYFAFVHELKSLLGFCIFNEESLSLLSETITLTILLAFDHLLPPTNAVTRQALPDNVLKQTATKNPSPDMLMHLFNLVQSLDNEIRVCHKHLDTTACDVKNIDERGGAAPMGRMKPNDSFPTLSWALNFYERLYLECCRQVIISGEQGSEEQAAALIAFRPLLQRIQASCALVCPIGTCVAALADFKVAPGVDSFLDGKTENALKTWATTFAELRLTSITNRDDATTQQNLILTCLFALLTSDRVIEAVLLSDFALLNIVCPVRRKVDYDPNDEKQFDQAHLAQFSDCITASSRLELLLGPFAHFVGSLSAVLARYIVNEPICIPPALQPRDVDFDDISPKNRSDRFVCVDPSFVAKADSLVLLFPAKIMMGFLLTGRYNEAVRLAQRTGNNSLAVLLAMTVHLFATSVPDMSCKLLPELSPGKQIREILESYTKPLDFILDFIFHVSTLGNSGASSLENHPAFTTGALLIKLDGLPKVSDRTLEATLLLSAICKKPTITRWSQTLCSLLHKTCYTLVSLFFSQLLLPSSKSSFFSSKSKFPLPPIYCAQMFDGISPDSTLLDLTNTRLGEVNRKIAADLVDGYISGVKCSKTLHFVVARWKHHLQKTFNTWSDAKASSFSESPKPDDFVITIEDPKAGAFADELKAFEPSSSQDCPTIDVLVDDFSSAIASMALWNLVDSLTVKWSHYIHILENDATNVEAILATESMIIDYLAHLLPFTLLLGNSNNSGKSLCFEVIVKIASKMIPRDRVAKLLGFATSLLVTVFGEELYDTFVNPRLEPLMEAWKGVADKETDASLIYIYANELKVSRDCFTEFGKRISALKKSGEKSFLAEFTSLLLSSSILRPFVANLFSVRLNPIEKVSKCGLAEMFVPENWSALMNKIISEAPSSNTNETGPNKLTPKALINSCLNAYLTTYPENKMFSGHMAVGNRRTLFKHICAVIRESSVWKAGAGGRTLAELERRRGDSNMFEFFQLMRSVDYPQFVNEIKTITQHLASLDFTPFQPTNVENEQKFAPMEISPPLVVHVLWMREIRSTQQMPAADLSGLGHLPDDEDEDVDPHSGQDSQQQPTGSLNPTTDYVPSAVVEDTVTDLQSYWHVLDRRRGHGNSNPSSSSSSTSNTVDTSDLSNQPNKSGHRPGGDQRLPAVHGAKSSSHGDAGKGRKLSSGDVKHEDPTTSSLQPYQQDQQQQRRSSLTMTKRDSTAQSFDDGIVTRVLENQAASFEAILTRFSEQQASLISEMVSFVESTYAGQHGEHQSRHQPPLQAVEKGESSSSSGKHRRKEKEPSSSSSSTLSTITSLSGFPRLLTLSCPPRQPLQNQQFTIPEAVEPTASHTSSARVARPMPRLLSLSYDPVDYNVLDENYLSEERLISVFKAASNFSGGSIDQYQTRLGPNLHPTDGVPPLIGVGMLRRFRVRRRKPGVDENASLPGAIPTTLIAEPTIMKLPVAVVQREATTRVVLASHVEQMAPRYTASIGVNTDQRRMISVGITAVVTDSRHAVRWLEPGGEAGIVDELLDQSRQAVKSRQDEFGEGLPVSRAVSSRYMNVQRDDLDPSVADIGLLSYLNRRPMPPVMPLPEKPKPILVNSSTDPPVFRDAGASRRHGPSSRPSSSIDASERYTTARSGLDENLRLVNPESFVMLEQQLGLGDVPTLPSEFLSVSDIAKREISKKNIQEAEVELDRLLENARKTLAWRSDQRTVQTQTEQPRAVDHDLDSWDIAAAYPTGLAMAMASDSDDQAQIDPDVLNDLAGNDPHLRNWSNRLNEIEQAGRDVRNDFARISQSADNLLPRVSASGLRRSNGSRNQTQQAPPVAFEYASQSNDLLTSGTMQSLEMPPILKKSVSFSDSMVEPTPRQEALGRSSSKPSHGTQRHTSSGGASPTTSPSTPHLDVVQLIDTGSLQPRSAAAIRQQRASPEPGKKQLMDAVRLSGSAGGASSTTTTTPSEMKDSRGRSGRPPLKLPSPAVTQQRRKFEQQKRAVVGQMQQRLDDASKLVEELIAEQETMRSRSKERWSSVQSSVGASRRGKQSARGTGRGSTMQRKKQTSQKHATLSDTDRKDAAMLASQFRDILYDYDDPPLQQHAGPSKRKAISGHVGDARQLREKEQHLKWLMEREADLAKPPSEPSETGDGDFAENLHDVDPAIAELLDKYSVHSGSVLSIVDWGEVDQMVAQQGGDEQS